MCPIPSLLALSRTKRRAPFIVQSCQCTGICRAGGSWTKRTMIPEARGRPKLTLYRYLNTQLPCSRSPCLRAASVLLPPVYHHAAAVAAQNATVGHRGASAPLQLTHPHATALTPLSNSSHLSAAHCAHTVEASIRLCWTRLSTWGRSRMGNRVQHFCEMQPSKNIPDLLSCSLARFTLSSSESNNAGGQARSIRRHQTDHPAHFPALGQVQKCKEKRDSLWKARRRRLQPSFCGGVASAATVTSRLAGVSP